MASSLMLTGPTKPGRGFPTSSTRARLYYASLARNPPQIPGRPSEPDTRYDVPVSGPVQLVYRGLPLDEIEDLLPQSAAYRQAGRILFAEPVSAIGRPVTPLHAGHVSWLAQGF
jgi:hypothetical protein